MWFARERVRTQGWSWPDAEAARNGDSLKALLDGAFEDVTRDKGVVAGQSRCRGVPRRSLLKVPARVSGD